MRSLASRRFELLSAVLTASMVAADVGSARAADWPELVLKSPPPPPSGSFWIGADYLLWSTKGDHLPALVTTSPPGTPRQQAGVLGAPGTTVLFGDGDVADGWRSGVRLRGGYWFEPQHRNGIEAEFFALGGGTQGLTASSPILAQPFVDATTGLPQSRLIALPGVATGSVAANDTSRLLGAGIDFRHELCGTCWFGTISGLAGYRFVRLRDSLTINSTITATGFAPIGTVTTTTDQFGTSNDFHGFHLGLADDVVYGPWTLSLLGKLSLGRTFTGVDIGGSNTVAVPGLAPVTTPGGFYAQPTNIGSTSPSHLSLLPELSADVSFRFADHLRAFAGYSLLYWTGVVRPGNTIDPVINPTLLIIGSPLVGPARPQPIANPTDYWAQGFNIGLTYDFGNSFIAAGLPSASAAAQSPLESFKVDPNNPAAARPSSFWIGADYLLWSTKGDHLPPLVTASPPGTPPGTLALFGDGQGDVADGWRSGARLRGGYWFEPQHRSGFEAQFFVLGSGIPGFTASDPTPAPPFFYISSGIPSATSVGALTASNSSSLLGGGIDYRHELCGTCAPGPISGLIGYQFLRLHDTLGVNATAPLSTGTVVTFADQLTTSNNFHGFDLGLTGDVPWGPWTLTWLGKIALGETFTSVDVGGSNTVAVPGLAPVTTPGGIYAQPANLGSTSSARVSLVPELSTDVSYRVADHVRISAGYTLLYWTGVERPGSGPAQPQSQSTLTEYWAQGFNFGLTYDY